MFGMPHIKGNREEESMEKPLGKAGLRTNRLHNKTRGRSDDRGGAPTKAYLTAVLLVLLVLVGIGGYLLATAPTTAPTSAPTASPTAAPTASHFSIKRYNDKWSDCQSTNTSWTTCVAANETFVWYGEGQEEIVLSVEEYDDSNQDRPYRMYFHKENEPPDPLGDFQSCIGDIADHSMYIETCDTHCSTNGTQCVGA